MSIDFPDSPTTGDTYTFSGRTWTWSGSFWEVNTSIGTVTIEGYEIANSEITTAKIADGAVTTQKLASTAVSAGSYINPSITVDEKGRLTSASSGSLSSYAPLASPTFTGNVVLPGTTTIGDVSSTELGYLDGTTSSIQTQINARVPKTSLPVSVSDYGAVGDGVTDNTTAFSNAAQARAGEITFDDKGILRAPGVFVTVPDGVYALSNLVDTDGRDVIWILDRGARVLNTENLNGEVLRQGQRIMQSPFGNEDNATGFAVRLYPNGSNFNDAAEVLGVANETDISVYTDRDAVAMFADVYAPPPTLTLTGATYTATTVVPDSAISAANLKLLRKGMIIDTAHSPTKYSGFITNWDANGTSITVEGWYLANGEVQSASTPPGSAAAYVNPFTKVWAHNANVIMNESSHADAMSGFELGLLDNKEASTAAHGGDHYVWGFDSVNLGTYKIESFFVARGSGFNGLRVDTADNAVYYRGTGNVTHSIRNQKTASILRSDGTMELGRQDTAATWYMDIHTSGNDETVNDYDARIQATGGSTTDGTATVTVFATNTDTQVLRPRTDSTYSLGTASRRWTTVYANTSTINTSDEREKEQISDIDEAVLRAWGKVQYQQFKFRDAVLEKGDGARWHVGLVAQRVKEAFESEGVDPFAYGILCYDEWEETEEKTEDGVGVVQEFQPSGSRYGIRYEEALALECAYLRSRLDNAN